MHMAKITREQFLNNAVRALKPVFKKIGYTLPNNVRVSVGWPSGTRPTAARRAIGECWSDVVSGDGFFEIFISPELGDRNRALDVLAHELVHVAAGFDQGHKGKFKECALRLGLTGPMTATTAGPKFLELLERAPFKALGNFPHAALTAMGGPAPAGKKGGKTADGADVPTTTGKKKQGTRLVKAECVGCGMIIRTTKKWVLETGLPKCACGSDFE